MIRRTDVAQDPDSSLLIDVTPEDVSKKLGRQAYEFMKLARQEVALYNQLVIFKRKRDGLEEMIFLRLRDDMDPKTGKPRSIENAKVAAKNDPRIMKYQDAIDQVSSRQRLVGYQLEAMRQRYGSLRTLAESLFSEELGSRHMNS